MMYIYIWDETCIAHIYKKDRELSDALRERWDHIKQDPKRKGEGTRNANFEIQISSSY